jgi:peptide deformylase
MRKLSAWYDRSISVPVYAVRTFPDPCLRGEAVPVESIGAGERRVLARMAETMYNAHGVGLAAPQVGIDQRLVVVDVGEGLVKLVNPEIIEEKGESTLEEGCISLPGVIVSVDRAKKVSVRASDERGIPVELEAEGLLARVLQHEIDHLNGVLIIDHGSEQGGSPHPD